MNSAKTARRRRLIAAAPALIIALLSAPGAAQSEKDKTASDKLYAEGLSKMLESKFDIGCPKLEESQRLFPRPGTLFTLAECEAKAGRYGTAIRRYQEYLSVYADLDPEQQSKQREKQRDKISTAQIDALSKQAPKLTIAVKGSKKGLTVKLDGAAVEEARLGTEILMDPGDHTVAADGGPGGPFEKKVTLAKGGSERVEIEGVKAAEKSVAKGPEKSESKPMSGQRIAAFAAGGAGAASLIVGAVMGGLALGKKDLVNTHCKDTGSKDQWACDNIGKTAGNDGKSLALGSTITFAIGAAGLAAGAVLFFTEPSSKKAKQKDEGASRGWVAPEVAAGPTGAFLGARGAW